MYQSMKERFDSARAKMTDAQRTVVDSLIPPLSTELDFIYASLTRYRASAILALFDYVSTQGYTMPCEDKAKWLHALRYEGYQQTKGVLYSLDPDKVGAAGGTFIDLSTTPFPADGPPPGGACCLGVYACVLGNGPKELLQRRAKWSLRADGKQHLIAYVPSYMNKEDFPEETREKIVPPGLQGAFATMNDAGGMTFEQIAALIEVFL